MYTLPIKKNQHRRGVTLLIVLALMVMFAMLITTFMVIVSLNRRNADLYAGILLGEPPEVRISRIAGVGVQENGALDEAFQLLLAGNSDLDTVISPYSILENFYGHSLGGNGQPFSGTGAPAKFALCPNILAPNDSGIQEYREYLQNNDVQMNPDYTAPDYMTMFLAWNDVSSSGLKKIIPSFHRPQLVKYWIDNAPNELHPNELRKFILRPLPTDHPDFTGSNPAANGANLENFLKYGPWDVDCNGDGRADSVWLDIGLPARKDTTGEWYKPLVAFYVIDMDGRINVNTFASLAQFESPDLSGLNIANILTNSKGEHFKGTGLGTAELTSNFLEKELLEERYGGDKIPADGNNSDLLIKNGINLDAYTKGGLLADWFGFSPIMFDTLGNRVVVTPTTDTDNPYLAEPYYGAGDDNPFQPDDLESLLRSVIDLDYNRLPLYLRQLLGDTFDPKAPTFVSPDRRYSLTTQSSDVPVAAPLYDHVRSRFGDKADELWKLLPEEIKRGEKVNLNRLTLRDDWMTGGTDLLKAKIKFAQEIFYLLQVLLPEQEYNTAELRERLAQWSVNLVDFIDPDDVMTPFIFRTDGTPEDCTGWIDNLLAGTLSLPSYCTLIWGFEKPEVALTKTFAVHDRRVEHDQFGDYQVKRPLGSLFVQLYRQGNRQRSYVASSLVAQDDESNTLNLAQKTGSGDYVWRLAVGKATKTSANGFKWNEGNNSNSNALQQLLTSENGVVKYPQFNQWSNGTSDGQYHPDLGAPDRYVWFGKDFPTADNDPDVRQRSFVNHDETDVALPPDSMLMIAPRLFTGFTDLGLGSIDLTGTNTMIATNPNVTIITDPDNPVDGSGIVEMNVSELLPTGTADQLSDAYTGRFGTKSNSPADLELLYQHGTTVACYKTICLQRLADPTRAHHPICNPYITVDWNMIDLQVINTEYTQKDDHISAEEDDDMRFSLRQWKEETASGFFNLWDRTLGENVLADDKAGLEKNLELNTLGESPRSKSLLHFPWNDAPLMNTGELMIVPASAPGWFGVEFHDNGTDKNFFGEEPRFSYNSISPYLNWAGDLAGTPAELPRLFDFAHVPSRFTGAMEGRREPGKINLNTVTEESWEALRGGRDHFPSYTELRRYRQWSTTPGDTAYPSEFRPFRSPMATQLVPIAEQIGTPASATLLDAELKLIDEEAINPYTALENMMRLSDVTTTRSNVFAVWITVGYFNVEKVDDFDAFQEKYAMLTHIDSEAMFKVVYPDGCILGAEKGLDDSTVQRHRAFYLIDRSILVDFSRGDVQDAEKVILNPARTQLD